MIKKAGVITGIMLSLAGGAVIVNSCVHAPYVMPATQRTNDPSICFGRDILPIFVSNCAKSGCHDARSGESGYVLDNYANIMRKGIVPGNVAASKIWESVTTGGGEDNERMPQGAQPLTAAQLDLLRRWIAYGAVDSGACYNSSCDSNNFTYSGAIAPLMSTYCTGCHNSASAAGGSLVDYASVRNAAVNGRLIGNITHQAGYNAMPPGLQLSECEIAQVEKWVAAGAPNN